MDNRVFWLKVAIHLGQWFALLWLYLAMTQGALGADPLQGLSHFTGKAAFHSLLLTLLVSPLAKWCKQGWLIRTRRLLGLYCFAWAVLHLLIYLLLDLGLNWTLFGQEITARPYLVLGAFAWLLLLALALTSTQAMQRRLGRRWQQLHHWVYAIVLLVLVHFIWSQKSGWFERCYMVGLSRCY